ncbi:hypothetical protein N288_21625 [Bacillus infantis NRRL B-14911]|uniref:Uncharacterized protein n=1 Tax=Bacillus infantis NRRL B-14911 TaxID=1367477 RepID=U5LFF2_9BACI|nr:hypothetical protein N288_21625 [Bacillus infantis NRRL B-14911]
MKDALHLRGMNIMESPAIVRNAKSFCFLYIYSHSPFPFHHVK